jgi:hypothetical protein
MDTPMVVEGADVTEPTVSNVAVPGRPEPTQHYAGGDE